jgi:peptide/nickel transport system permease protein
LLRYSLTRILATIPLIIGLSVVVFFGIRLLPGDPVGAMLGVFGNPELVEKLKHRYGFDQPVLSQYLIWVSGALRGDFGVSVASQMEIGPLIAARLPATIELMIASIAVAIGLAIPAGLTAGMHEGGRKDRIISGVSFVGLGIPAWLLGMVLIAIFSIWLKILPAGGYVPFVEDPIANLQFLFMPALANGLASTAYLLRLTRTGVISVRREPFVGYGAAKGLSDGTIRRRLIFRNVQPRIVSVIGLYAALLLAGSITVEILFSWPGMARMFVAAVNQRDYAIVQALILVYAVVFILINLAAELAQAALDPRIRLR